jgi:hypothetical protein
MKRKQKFLPSRMVFSAIGVIGTWMCYSAPARADLIVTIGSISANAGSSSNPLEITLANTGPSPVTIGGFAFGITTANPAITFTEADTATVPAPYIFSGDSLFGPIISTLTGATLEASDLFDVFGSGATVNVGKTVGLGHVLFDVAGNAALGPSDVTFEIPATNLADENGNSVSINSLVSGAITVNGGAVPEPATVGLVLCAFVATALLSRRRA